MPPDDDVPVVPAGGVQPPTGVEDKPTKDPVVKDPVVKDPVVKDPAPKVGDPAPSAKEKDAAASIKKVLSGDEPDEELDKHIDEKGNLTIPIKAWRTRINRATKTFLKEWFGTEDKAEARKKLEDYEAAVKDRDEDRRSKLAENDRLKEDVAKETKKREEAEAKLAAREHEQDVREVEKEVLTAAKLHVDDDEDSLDSATRAFKKHVRTLDKKETRELEKGDAVEKWFEKWAKEHPKHARVTEKKPIDNGLKGTKKKPDARAAGADNGKGVKDMSDVEYKQYLKSRGINA